MRHFKTVLAAGHCRLVGGILVIYGGGGCQLSDILLMYTAEPIYQYLVYIVTRLRELSGDNEQRFRNYYEMLETLADNRDLQANLDEAKQMLTQVDVTRFSTYRWGLEAGWNQAKAEYEQSLAEKEAALEKKETALAEQRELLKAKDTLIQEEKQRIAQAVKQLIAFNTLSYQAIADLMNIPVEEVEAIAQEVSKH